MYCNNTTQFALDFSIHIYDICGKCHRNIRGNDISNFASMQNREDLRAIQKINKNNCNDNVKHIF